jgi:hypothetical protein
MSSALDRARALSPEQVAAVLVALDDAAIALREVLDSSRIDGLPALRSQCEVALDQARDALPAGSRSGG